MLRSSLLFNPWRNYNSMTSRNMEWSLESSQGKVNLSPSSRPSLAGCGNLEPLGRFDLLASTHRRLQHAFRFHIFNPHRTRIGFSTGCRGASPVAYLLERLGLLQATGGK
ncbi:hypothetical protein L6452_18192 [Arctium lappa]|uniref:Uncharacterized protein n=1 Tax=Arctium lappa TaxID=4217 RepID=A0ACB9C5G5_ARCLA|nr:hypothetical protein L6452_18192 [Arctium lappa]